MSARLLVTADDRTGALEVGGVIANDLFPVSVATEFSKDICSVVDIDSRHMTPAEAYNKVASLNIDQKIPRCHKMDSGLRGNWPQETRALLDQGYKVSILPAYPQAGRRCSNGVVYIDDVPLLESPFGADPLSAPCSNKPIEVMEQAGLTDGDFLLLDGDDELETEQGVTRTFKEDRILISPTGPIETYAKLLFGQLKPRKVAPVLPLLIICGSLNATSREQIEYLQIPTFDVSDNIDTNGPITVVLTPLPSSSVSQSDAYDMARDTAKLIQRLQDHYRTILIIGGETTAHYLQENSVSVLGTVTTGVPISHFGDRLLITKGGGIGNRQTLFEITAKARATEAF